MSISNEMWGIEEVMEYTGLTRRGATRLLKTEGCPTMPRGKGEKYQVPSQGFIKWFSDCGWA